MSAVPVIDISSLFLGDESAKAELARCWDETLQKVGFAVITGHQVPQDVCDILYKESKAFFALPDCEKEKANLFDKYGSGGFIGKGRFLTDAGKEAVARSAGEASARPDLVENFSFHDEAREPADAVAALPPSLAAAAATYWKLIRSLLTKLMELSALALGLPTDFFEKDYEHAACFLKLAFYPEPNEGEHEQPRYGAHTDYQVMTILRQDPEYTARNGGLEVLFPNGEWVGCPHVPNSFVINTGDLMQRWTNDRWRSNTHRVAACGLDERVTSRLSLVFFTGPSDDTVVAKLPSCSSAALYAPITAKDHLLMKIGRTQVADS